MNKKPQRSNVRAPTTQPTATIAPSGTLAMDGEFPLSASNGVTSPEPLAAHDVLHAAMAPRESEQPEADAPAVDASVTDVAADNDAANAPQQAAPENNAADAGQAKNIGKKSGKKPGKERGKEPGKAAEKVAKDKFVKCTFSLPESEMLVLDGLKKTHQVGGAPLKKSQLLRVALLALVDIDAGHLAHLVAQLPVEKAASKKKK